jgi:hypothetical protein
MQPLSARCLPGAHLRAGADVAALEAAAAAGGKAAAASRGVARSDRVLVVKNLPFSASLEELETLFGGIGKWAGGRWGVPFITAHAVFVCVWGGGGAPLSRSDSRGASQ